MSTNEPFYNCKVGGFEDATVCSGAQNSKKYFHLFIHPSIYITNLLYEQMKRPELDKQKKKAFNIEKRKVKDTVDSCFKAILQDLAAL